MKFKTRRMIEKIKTEAQVFAVWFGALVLIFLLAFLASEIIAGKV